MKEYTKVIQFLLISLSLITFKKVDYGPLKITLFVVLCGVILQQFLYIYNSENSDKPVMFISSIKNEIIKSILILLLEGLLISVIYFLSMELVNK